jgi:hypothetical protein
VCGRLFGLGGRNNLLVLFHSLQIVGSLVGFGSFSVRPSSLFLIARLAYYLDRIPLASGSNDRLGVSVSANGLPFALSLC